MKKLTMYCLSIHDNTFEIIKDLGYIPVGLGENKLQNNWLKDNSGKNISDKNKFYGEYSFHYWFWKNVLPDLEDGNWIGFCAYREFWGDKNAKTSKSLKEMVIKEIPEEWEKFDVIIGEHRTFKTLKELKLSKILKYGILSLIRNPSTLFSKEKKINIRLQFDMMHGNGNLDKAIDLLDDENRESFRKFTVNEHSFARGNMFICKSKKIMNRYYESLFPWLERCEKIFGFDLDGYGMTRIYAFLGERYLSYWFSKNTNHLLWPVIFYDTNKFYEN